jgi:hypothetical protein
MLPMAGYSGTSLLKKLGIKEGQKIAFLRKPQGYAKNLGKLPVGVSVADQLSAKDGKKLDWIQLFATSQAGLKRDFLRARKCLASNGSLWISWPKKSSGVKTDLNENLVRRIGLALGLVDVKICAVDDTWSALKFVYRLKDRV